MPFYRYRITPRSAFGTPLQSDTLYGHLLCAARMLDGEEKITNLIEGFSSGAPPFLISSAFPAGMLPMPLLAPVSRLSFQAFTEQSREFSGNLFKALGEYKKFKKVRFLPLEIFAEFQERLNLLALFECWLKRRDSFSRMPEKREFQPHNSIDRITGAVLNEGGLYFNEATYYSSGAELDIYLHCEDIHMFERYFSCVADTGFGADRSTGKGYFSFQRDQEFDATPFSKELPGKMILSVCSNMDLSEFAGTYSTITKYGKVWNGFGERNPFKKPFLAFAEGACFSETPSSGYVLSNIHPDSRVVQITMPLTIPAGVEVNHVI